MAFGYKNHTKIAPNKIIQYIANSDADIVCLQEYATAKSEKSLTASKIYDALSMYPYRSVFYQSSTKFPEFRYRCVLQISAVEFPDGEIRFGL